MSRPSSPSVVPEPPAQPFEYTSSPTKRSRFTHRNLHLLRQNSPTTPLRVIAHIDLDAFYAQCEMVRLGTPRSTPLAVQQWDSLIAVNYAARDYGISRMITAKEARAKCPELITQHVATFREGEGGKWAYREDAAGRVKTDKVSLDPYRAESRKIIATIKGTIRERAERYKNVGLDMEQGLEAIGTVEKAGIDEVFVDLSAMVYWELLERYPELRGLGGDAKDELPPPPTTALQWAAEDELVDLDKNETEDDDPDWDDVAMLIGSDIIRNIRADVWEKLHYTCSGGVAKNKMMAKLGSARYKPNKQAVVRNRAVEHFLSGFKFTKIRMLGGKLGKRVSSLFDTEEIGDLLKIPVERLKSHLGDDTGTWLYEVIRGEDFSELSPRTQIKTMCATKSFRPGLNSADQAERWLRIFAAEIYGRLIEENVLENKRRPKTITLYNRRSGQDRSRQTPIPAGKSIDEMVIFELGKSLLRQVVSDRAAWPCSNLALSVGAFEDGVVGNRAIEGYLLRGVNAGSAKHPGDAAIAQRLSDDIPASKKRKLETTSGIQRFFTKRPTPEEAQSGGDDLVEQDVPADEPNAGEIVGEMSDIPRLDRDISEDPELEFDDHQYLSYTCPRCTKSILNGQKDEHNDWHFAKDLESQDRETNRANTVSQPHPPRPPSRPASGSSKSRKQNGSRGNLPKGQKRLAFG
ncbi:DNA-directed DNA polymerase eta rad30 [Arachnomyces sp. PD_36]|nr:DNA-directed DNA polymerase eta rad30 [Arachnomyces sp. PD_36]